MASGPQSAVAAQRQPLLIVADYLDSRSWTGSRRRLSRLVRHCKYGGVPSVMRHPYTPLFTDATGVKNERHIMAEHGPTEYTRWRAELVK